MPEGKMVNKSRAPLLDRHFQPDEIRLTSLLCNRATAGLLWTNQQDPAVTPALALLIS
jgi:hypothetical protein